MGSGKKHSPPPTRFGVQAAQPKPQAGPPKVAVPPPTRFGPQPVQAKPVQAKPVQAKPLGAKPVGTGAVGFVAPPTRFAPHPVQAKPCGCASHAAPKRGMGQVIQRMEDEEKYPEDPPSPSGGFDVEFYQDGMNYHYDEGNTDAYFAYGDVIEDRFDTSIGQTLGTQESEDYDESYVDIPLFARPSAPAALWKKVYAGLTDHPTKKGVLRVLCDELHDGYVKVDKKTKCEIGTKKRPPMCHVIPYNHIRWAVSWLENNRSNVKASGYKGPGLLNFDGSTWKDLVWHTNNLRPGHSLCNSKTASAAKGIPSSKEQSSAIDYVVKALKNLQPTWF